MKVRKNLRCQLTTGGLLLRLQCMLGAPIHPCKSFVFVSQHDCVVTDPSLSGMAVTRGGGGPWVFFGWVSAARDSKLAPRSKKIFP